MHVLACISNYKNPYFYMSSLSLATIALLHTNYNFLFIFIPPEIFMHIKYMFSPI